MPWSFSDNVHATVRSLRGTRTNTPRLSHRASRDKSGQAPTGFPSGTSNLGTAVWVVAHSSRSP